MEYVDLIVSILAGLAVCIPVVIRLGQTISTALREKNWSKIMELAIDFMEQAEQMFDKGTDRKTWVLAMVRTSAEKVNYDYDSDAEEKVSKLVDSICEAAKVVNTEG